MDSKIFLYATAISIGLYIILAFLEKILIRKKSKQLLEVNADDNRTSNGTDTVTDDNEQLS